MSVPHRECYKGCFHMPVPQGGMCRGRKSRLDNEEPPDADLGRNWGQDLDMDFCGQGNGPRPAVDSLCR